MRQVQLTGVSIAFGDRQILDSVNLHLSCRSRTALTGANGSGKSTLMKIISGETKPDSGTITQKDGIRISYLPQSGVVHLDTTLREEVEEAFSYLDSITRNKAELEQSLQGVTQEDPEVSAIIEKRHELEEILIRSGYYTRETEIQKVLSGLGFTREDVSKRTREFSGGWQMRIALAKVLLEKPDILLLDEPTNYLDIEAREWLTRFISTYDGGFLIVSHDRHFLDSLVDEIMEIFHGRIKQYRGNFSAYECYRKTELETLLRRYERQQNEIEKTEQFIQRFRSNASKAALVQSRITWLKKCKRIEIPETLKRIHFSFPPPPHSGRRTVSASNLTKRYGTTPVFTDVQFSVDRGEKIVLTGVNGAGKSTLLRIIAGRDRDFEGTIEYGKDVDVGYFAVENEGAFNPEHTIIQALEEHCPTGLIPTLRNMLGAFLFRNDDIYKTTGVLSGGEKSRLSLLKLLLHPANLLILDEPTNHLDIHSKDILLNALQHYSGTIFFVSHDRYFIQQLATRVFRMHNGSLQVFHGDYDFYLWKTAGEGDRERRYETPPVKTGDGKKKRDEEKQKRNRIRKLEQKEQDILEQLEEGEKAKQALEGLLQLPEQYSDPEKAKKIVDSIKAVEKKLHHLSETWESVSAELHYLSRS